MDDAELARWREGLEALASPVISTDDAGRRFADEMGHRRAVDDAFLAWCGRGATPGARTGHGESSLDVALWEGVARARGDAGLAREALRDAAVDLSAAGSLTRRDAFGSIEVWTETELGALHAMWWLARWSGQRRALERVAAAAAWHVGEMQPDNGTNHPWGLHVFLLLERERPGIGGLAYAEALLQNCRVALGRPDLLSAYVLRDCARGIGESLERRSTG